MANLPPPNTSFFGWLGQKLPGPASFIQEKAIPAVAGALESPLAWPLIAADKAVDTFVRRPLGTSFATLQNLTATGELDPLEAWRQTSREALPGNSISMGQSFSTLFGQRIVSRNPIIGGLLRQAELDDDLYKYVPYLNPDFNIMDPQQRKEAYLDSFYGSLSTGTADVTLELVLSRGAGQALKVARIKSGAQRVADPKTERILETEVLAGRQAWIDQGRPIAPGEYKAPNGFSVWIQDIVTKKDPKQLLNNPIMGRSPHLTELAARIDDWDTAAAFALATRGNARAALALKQTSPALADSLEAELFPSPLRPLTTADELSDFSKMADKEKIANVKAIFNDLVERDPSVQVLVDDLAYTAYRGQSLNPTWAPSKFSAIETVRNKIGDVKAIRYQAATGDAIEEVMVGGGIFRPILSLHVRGLNWKPLGYVSLSGPFRKDAYDEISATIANSEYLRKLEANPATRPLVNKLRDDAFTRVNLAVDETTKRAALEKFQDEAMGLIVTQTAKEFDAPDGMFDAGPTIQKIREKQNLAIRTAIENDVVPDDFYIDVHVGANLKSKLADSVVLIDLNVFKKMVDEQIDTYRPVVDKLKATPGKISRAIQLQGENINSFFSAAVLIRPGYIPKNSIFEPAMRYMMETGNLFDMELFLPAIANSMRNARGTINALGEGVSHLVIPSKRKAAQRVRAERLPLVKERSRVYKEDLRPLNKQIQEQLKYRKNLKENPLGMSESMVKELLKDTNDQLKALLKIRSDVQGKIKELDLVISELSGQLPRAARAAARGAKETIMRREQNIWLGSQGTVQFKSFMEDGGTAYLQELGDAQQSLFNAAGLTIMDRRQRTLGSFRTPERGTKEYWQELEVEIQRFSKADPGGIGILEGKTVREVANDYWKAYRELGTKSPLYRLVVGRRYADLENGSPSLDAIEITRKDATFFAQQAAEFAAVFLADPALRASALTRRIGWKELRERFKDYEILPKLQPRFFPADATGLQKAINAYIGTSRKAFRALVAPETRLFRYQLADNAYREGLRIMGLNALDQGKELTPAVMRDIENSARQYAVDKVTSTFYQVRRMNNYQYYSRFMLGFPSAMYNSLKFYAIAGLTNPYNYALLEQLRTSPWAVGTVVNDDGQMVNEKGFLIDDGGNYIDSLGNKSPTPVKHEGETYLLLPSYSDILNMAKGKEVTKGVKPYNKKINTRQFNFLVNGPGLVWFGQVGLNKIIASFPSIETTLKNALGERGYGNLVFEGRVGPGFGTPGEEIGEVVRRLTPKWSQDLATLAALGTDELVTRKGNAILFKPGPVASTVNMVHNARIANRRISDPFNTEEPDLETTAKMSYGILITRLAERFFSPLGISYQPTSQIYQDKLNQYKQYYTLYPEHAGGMSADDAAMFKLVAENGEDVLSTMGFLTGTKERTVSLDYTQTVSTNLKKYFDSGLIENAVGENKDRIKSLPIIVEPTIPGEFSPAAYSFINSFNNSGIKLAGIPRDFYDMRAEAQKKAGWFEYSKLQNKVNSLLLGRPSNNIQAASNSDILQLKRTKETELKKLYPAWYEESGGSKAVPRFRSNLAVINAALEDDGFMNGLTGVDKVKWNFIQAWYVEYESLIGSYQKSANKTFRANVRDYWNKRTMQLIQANTHFADFHSRWLSGDQIIDASRLTAEAPVAATPQAQQTQQQVNPSTVDTIASIVGG